MHTHTHAHNDFVEDQCWLGLYLYPKNIFKTFVITISIFLLKPVQVILVPRYCLFCVLSRDMLNVSLGTFIRRYTPSKTNVLKNPQLQFGNSHILPMLVNKASDLVCKFSKPIIVICMNPIHELM